MQPVLGLEVRIQSGRAIYYALPANRFGLKTDSYAGEFIPFVNMGQADGSSAETGGMVLAGSVVTRLIEDKLATIKSDYDRWIVALPVDIRSSPRIPVDVSFDQFGLAGWSNTPRPLVMAGARKQITGVSMDSTSTRLGSGTKPRWTTHSSRP